MKIFELKNISYSYPLDNLNVIDNLSVSLEENEFISIIGNNGAGKSTLCNILRQFIPHFYKGSFSGEINLFGKSLASYNNLELVESLGYMSQNPFVQISGARKTVFEEIAFGLENLGWSVHEIKDRVEEILEIFGITSLRALNPLILSGGQKQKVALAALVAMDTRALILDEPTSQLDPGGTLEIFQLLNDLKEKGKTIIIAEHKMELVAEYSDTIIFLNQGQLEKQGSPTEVFNWILNQNLNMKVPEFMRLTKCVLEKNAFVGMKDNDIPATAEEARELLKKAGITYDSIKSC